MNVISWYSKFTKNAALFCARPRVFTLASAVIVVWIITGPVFDFSDTWQLVMNTGAGIITFLMVFIIQNTQNRDTAAIQVKLDELIRVTQGARNTMLGIEEMEQEQLDEFRAKYRTLASEARAESEIANRQTDKSRA